MTTLQNTWLNSIKRAALKDDSGGIVSINGLRIHVAISDAMAVDSFQFIEMMYGDLSNSELISIAYAFLQNDFEVKTKKGEFISSRKVRAKLVASYLEELWSPQYVDKQDLGRDMCWWITTLWNSHHYHYDSSEEEIIRT